MPKILFMKNANEFIFVLSLFLTLFMGVLSFLIYKRHRDVKFSHLIEFWMALSLHVICSYLFLYEYSHLAPLTMLGWIWPMKAFKSVMEDISGSDKVTRWHYLTLGVGAFVSFALGGYGYPFIWATLPFALAASGVGLHIIFLNFKLNKKDFQTPFHIISSVLFGLFFAVRLLFPLWGSVEEGRLLGFFADLILISGFTGTLFATYLIVGKHHDEEHIQKILKERSEKFLGQSKYSELGMMSAGIAHEINNPLAVIQARTTQLLRIYRQTERQKDLADGLQQILYTSERINRTIQGIREFVHQDERGPSVEVTLKTLFDDILAFCGQRMKNHGVNLRFYGLENFSVVGNKIQLEQVILNLLNNSFDAIEYLPDKWIEVTCKQKGDRIQLYFKDSGPGIPTEIASRMMEPFFSTKDIGKGTGLGLALAKGIVEKHRGSLIYVKDSPHTTFLLELPGPSFTTEWGMPLH
jgi:signal transduction histidine kinase